MHERELDSSLACMLGREWYAAAGLSGKGRALSRLQGLPAAEGAHRMTGAAGAGACG